jgi:hypothetical protein
MTILARSLRPTLGPLPCLSCGRLVVYGVAVQVFHEDAYNSSLVRRRDLYDASTEAPHRCAAAKAQAA